MRIFVSSLDVPIGYSTPVFPSLFWPLGPLRHRFNQLYLYYSFDIWKFTVYWAMIFFASSYLVAGLTACANMNLKRRREFAVIPQMNRAISARLIFIVVAYLAVGTTRGFLSGAIVGLLLQAIYRAGALSMSTWIPFCWGCAQILYHISSSYSTSSLLM